MFDFYHMIAFHNLLQMKLKLPSRKFANNEDEDNSNYRPTPPAASDGDEDVSNSPDEKFAYQAGREFFFIHGPWIHSGDDLFDTNIITHYNAVERFENDENMCHKWLRCQVSSIYML